jgi:CBS domain-containing protein
MPDLLALSAAFPSTAGRTGTVRVPSRAPIGRVVSRCGGIRANESNNRLPTERHLDLSDAVPSSERRRTFDARAVLLDLVGLAAKALHEDSPRPPPTALLKQQPSDRVVIPRIVALWVGRRRRGHEENQRRFGFLSMLTVATVRPSCRAALIFLTRWPGRRRPLKARCLYAAHVASSELRVVGDDDDRESPQLREFFRVVRLIPDEQRPVTVPTGTRVREALVIMANGNFSQVPVLAGDVVAGVFSYRSLAQHLPNVRRQDDPLDELVDDMLEDLTYVRATADVGDILASLGRDGAVLIGDEDDLLGIATTTDAIDFFWRTARPFVLVQDIELAVRDLMRVACPDADEMARRIAKSVNVHGPRTIDELSLGDLIAVLTNGENFGQRFSSTFGQNRLLVLTCLEAVRDIRNQVFHFRDDVSIEQLESLTSARAWLARKVRIARSRR